jgi:hypothetical protein
MLFGIRPIDKCIHVDHWHDPTEQLVNNQYNIGSKCGDLILIRLILLNFIQCLIKVVVIVASLSRHNGSHATITSFEVTRLVTIVPLEVLLLFGVIRDPGWSLWVIETFLLLFHKKCMLCHQTFQNFSLGDPMSLSNWENPISALLSHRINYKIIYIHIINWWGFSREFNSRDEQRKTTLH